LPVEWVANEFSAPLLVPGIFPRLAAGSDRSASLILAPAVGLKRSWLLFGGFADVAPDYLRVILVAVCTR